MTTQQPIAIVESGLVCSVGLNSPAACAAIRAAVTNHQETRFMDSGGEWIIGASVPLENPWRGLTKLVKMLAMAIQECLARVNNVSLSSIPLLLCIAENDRPGRIQDLDKTLYHELQQELGIKLNGTSSIISHGRISGALALAQARKLIYKDNFPMVLVVGVDSLLNGSTLKAYEERERLLTSKNSNGFIPGEAASAVILGRPSMNNSSQLICTGIGYAIEKAHIESEEPLRADGLSEAIRGALAEANCEMSDMDFRITDISGEQYYFKEASLALSRTLRKRKEEFDIWHPADCIGEIGAAIGPAIMAVTLSACRKAYTVGNNILLHLGNDEGHRVAAVLKFN